MPTRRFPPKNYERKVYRQRRRRHRQHVPDPELPIWAAFWTNPRWPTYSFPMAYTHRAARQMNVRADVRCKSRSMPRNGLFDRYLISAVMGSHKEAGGFYYEFTFEVVDCPAYSYHHFRFGHSVPDRLPRYSHPYIYETVPASRHLPQRYHVYYLRSLKYDARPRLEGRNEGDYQRLASATPSLVGEWKAPQQTLGIRKPHRSATKRLHELHTTEVAAAKFAISGRYNDPLSVREHASLERGIERNQQRGYSDIKRFFAQSSHRDKVHDNAARPAGDKGKGRDTDPSAIRGKVHGIRPAQRHSSRRQGVSPGEQGGGNSSHNRRPPKQDKGKQRAASTADYDEMFIPKSG